MVGQERHLLQRRTLRLHQLSLKQAWGAGAEGRWIAWQQQQQLQQQEGPQRRKGQFRLTLLLLLLLLLLPQQPLGLRTLLLKP